MVPVVTLAQRRALHCPALPLVIPPDRRLHEPAAIKPSPFFAIARSVTLCPTTAGKQSCHSQQCKTARSTQASFHSIPRLVCHARSSSPPAPTMKTPPTPHVLPTDSRPTISHLAGTRAEAKSTIRSHDDATREIGHGGAGAYIPISHYLTGTDG